MFPTPTPREHALAQGSRRASPLPAAAAALAAPRGPGSRPGAAPAPLSRPPPPPPAPRSWTPFPEAGAAAARPRARPRPPAATWRQEADIPEKIKRGWNGMEGNGGSRSEEPPSARSPHDHTTPGGSGKVAHGPVRLPDGESTPSPGLRGRTRTAGEKSTRRPQKEVLKERKGPRPPLLLRQRPVS